MKIIVITLLALGLVASILWRDQPADLIDLLPGAAARATPPPVPAALPRLSAALPLNAGARPVAERCETSQVEGSHTARAEWEARQGALEDAADICPSGKITPTRLRCTPVDGAHGVMGYAGVKCVQQVACSVCGEALARKLELNR